MFGQFVQGRTNRRFSGFTAERRIPPSAALALAPLDFNTYFGGLYPVYVRGLAYLAMNRGVEAAAEFQKILNHKGLTAGDPVCAMAQLQLARAWELAGDNAKAKAAYQQFLNLWKDADPSVPVLKQATAELATL